MSTKMKTVIVVVVLLVGIGVFNYIIKMDPTQLAARGVGKDPHSHGEEEEHEHEGPAATLDELTRPIGPEDAPVTITALWTDQQELERILRPMLTEVATGYDDHVRVEFVAPGSDEEKRIAEEVTGGITSGLLINGEMIKEVPEADLGVLAFSGSPTFEEWSVRDLRLAVEHELEAAGVEFEPQVEHDHGPPAGSAHDPHAGHSH